MALLATRTRARSRSRRHTPVELAIAFALGGSLLAVAVPTFVREVHESRFVEPVEGLERIGAAAVAYADAHPSGPSPMLPVAGAGAPGMAPQVFPVSAPLTPPAPPRGKCAVDPPGTWDHGTWSLLEFQPSPTGAPHCFAFAFDSVASPGKATFKADAHGDLDGDGITSTFEVTGHATDGDPQGPTLEHGMFVDSEVE